MTDISGPFRTLSRKGSFRSQGAPSDSVESLLGPVRLLVAILGRLPESARQLVDPIEVGGVNAEIAVALPSRDAELASQDVPNPAGRHAIAAK